MALVGERVIDSLVGHIVGDKFRVDALLGHGSMAVVYKARHLALKRPVALKVMRGFAAIDPRFAERFKREANTAFKLDHANSVRVLDFGQDANGMLYMAMEYIEGQHLLATLAEDFPLPASRIARLVSQVLAALAAAHDVGIVHRDLKPENIMVTRATDDDGSTTEVVKVCDFGVAKVADTSGEDSAGGGATKSATLTHRGMTVGTPNYMAPEQALGQATDGRTDIYAVGVLLFQLLTKRLPFVGVTPVQVMLKHVEEIPPRPSELAGNVDPELERVCLKALQKDPAARFQSAREMRAQLRLVGASAAEGPGGLAASADASAEASALKEDRARAPEDERGGAEAKKGLAAWRGGLSLAVLWAVLVAVGIAVGAVWILLR